MRTIILLFIGTLWLSWLETAAAGDISLLVKSQKEVIVTNTTKQTDIKYIEPKVVIPGDIILYTIKYHHNGKLSAQNVSITNPIPNNMEYIEGSARGELSTISFSLDGGKTYDTPDKLVFKKPDGTSRPANVRDYTNVRWIIKELKPGSEGVVSYRARLE